MSFKVGDEVMCIDAKPLPYGTSNLVAGRTYTILAVHRCKETFVTVNDLCARVMQCKHCSEPGADYYSWRFIKLPKVEIRTQETSEAEAS